LSEPIFPSEINDIKFVWSYHGELRLFYRLNDGIQETSELNARIQRYKVDLLEYKLGYPIEFLDNIIQHDEFERELQVD